jgi:tetratricopeptide (TPR) repeat protein
LLDNLGKYKEAEIEIRQRLEALPTHRILHYELAQCLFMQGREKESMEEFAEGIRFDGSEKLAADVRAAFTRAGNRGVQEWRLANLKQQMAAKDYVSPLEFAFAYARLGQNDEAFRWLDKAYDDHVPGLIWLQQNSELNRLRVDPRYQALVKRIGLP